MKKLSPIVFLLIISSCALKNFAQTDDGHTHKTLNTYSGATETARISITLEPGFTADGTDEFETFLDAELPFNGGTATSDGDYNKNYIRQYTPLHDHKSTIEPVHDSLDYSQWAENISCAKFPSKLRTL